MIDHLPFMERFFSDQLEHKNRKIATFLQFVYNKNRTDEEIKSLLTFSRFFRLFFFRLVRWKLVPTAAIIKVKNTNFWEKNTGKYGR